MSTKSSVKYNPKGNEDLPEYHLYREMFDEDNIYLEARGIDFEVTPKRITIKIPWKLWNELASCGKLTKVEGEDCTGDKIMKLEFGEDGVSKSCQNCKHYEGEWECGKYPWKCRNQSLWEQKEEKE